MKKPESPITPYMTVRKRRNRQPTFTNNGDSTVIKYKAIGENVEVYSGGLGAQSRWYVPGFNARLNSGAGPGIVAKYATGLFKPGTTIRWEPTISPTKGGRIFVAFTDNPEVMVSLYNAQVDFLTSPSGASYAVYSNLVKSLANLTSTPAWMEYEWQVPLKARRKRFDCNESNFVNDINVMDRACQVAMFACVDGLSDVVDDEVIGSFWFHDVVDVEGLGNVAT